MGYKDPPFSHSLSLSLSTFGECSFSEIILHKNTREKFLLRDHESLILILVFEKSLSVSLFLLPSPPMAPSPPQCFLSRYYSVKLAIFYYTGQKCLERLFPLLEAEVVVQGLKGLKFEKYRLLADLLIQGCLSDPTDCCG